MPDARRCYKCFYEAKNIRISIHCKNQKIYQVEVEFGDFPDRDQKSKAKPSYLDRIKLLSSGEKLRKEMEEDEPEERTKCEICVSGCKQVTTFTLSHAGLLTLVVLYCVAGAAIFQGLEATNELAVKKNMTWIRGNVSENLWKMTEDMPVIKTDLWSKEAIKILENFEKELLTAIKDKGWDGKEDQKVKNWTYLGSLFYSIIVITTIGYGHIAPKTVWGKVVTIFYAIIGIPLMVVCWSHIGDFMANAFRFLYWKVCCYICTRNPRPKRGTSMRSRTRSTRGPPSRTSGSTRMKSKSIKRNARTSQRSADSAVSDSVTSVASDPGLLYQDSRTVRQHSSTLPRTTQPHSLPHPSRLPQRSTKSAEPEILPTPQQQQHQSIKNMPVLFNRYAEDVPSKISGSNETKYDDRIDEEEMAPQPTTSRLSRNRIRSTPPQPPMQEEMEYWEEDVEEYEYEYDDYEDVPHERRQVPIWLCSFLVLGYIIGGAFLFSNWEGWGLLDSIYFCFITLTTIGFGDFVPAQKFTNEDSEVKDIAFCSLYLLFGIALLAMSFNLVQEQVINAFKDLAMRLGILPDEEEQ